MLLAVLRHADTVKIACLSELVNCISHLRTRDGGGCWVLPAYYTYLHYSKYGRGTSLETKVISDTYSCSISDQAPYLDAQGVLEDDGSLTLFAINRSLEEELELKLELRGFESYQVDEHIILTADDPKASNSEEEPDKVVPSAEGNAAVKDGCVAAKLPKMSWNVIRLKM